MSNESMSAASPDGARRDLFPTFRSALANLNRWVKASLKNSKSWPRKLGRGLLKLALVGIVLYAAFNIYASIILNRELAATRQRGEPLTFAELAPPPVPDSENAAILYRRAIASVQLLPGEQEQLMRAGTEATISPSALAILQRNAVALQLARQASSMPKCRFPIPWEASPEQIAFPHYNEMRTLARLLAAQAVHEAQKGYSANALSDIRSISRISRHTIEDPTLTGFLVARVLQAIADRALSRVLEINSISVSQGHQFEASLPRIDWDKAVERAVMVERAFALYVFNSLGSGHGQSLVGTPDNSLVPASGLLWRFWKPFLKLDEVYLLRLYQRILAAGATINTPMPNDAEHNPDKYLETVPFYARVTLGLFPSFSGTRSRRITIVVAARQREIALALAGFRVALGRYPERLEQAEKLWGKALPLDPCGNKPFKYRSDGHSFTLYSVGENGADDKGVGRSITISPSLGVIQTETDDITWGPRGSPHPDSSL